MSMEPSSGFVALMGIGVVFAGLIVIVLLCTVMSAIIRAVKKSDSAEVKSAAPAAAAAPAPAAPAAIADRGALAAAVSAAIAEELGESVSAIRILSIKRV